MKTFFGISIFLVFSFLFIGCSIKQEISAVKNTNRINEICIVDNPPVRAGFLQTMKSKLLEKGYQIKMIPSNSTLKSCHILTTYMGRWSWDVAIYLSYANIKVYKNGNLYGEALYDSRNGSINMNKFIKGEDKINELVDLLFPNNKSK